MTEDRRQRIRSAVIALITKLGVTAAEYLDAVDDVYCVVEYSPRTEDKASRMARARQEMKILRLLDDAGSVTIGTSETMEFDAWEACLSDEGLEFTMHRIGDRGILHVFTRKDTPKPNHIDQAMEATADEIERILKR
jgi:hypothetical protein